MPKLEPIANALLAWYHANRRVLPFREDPKPYHIWVSEIMLQQTRVAAALPYYERFMRELPSIEALAACDEEKLHKLWEGLGYYSRVRNLQKAARIVVEEHGGQLPGDYNALLALPGIGEYTAGAIASIAFGLPEVAVDGNVLRVFARLTANGGDVMLPAVKKELSAEVQRQQPPKEAGDYNQAIMELGALVCLPGTPLCGECPLAKFCQGKKQGIESQLPFKAPKKPKEELDICLLAVLTENKRVLLHKRPSKGLLAGLWEPVFLEGKYNKQEAQVQLEKMFGGAVLEGELPASTHIFTHKIWQMNGWVCHVEEKIVEKFCEDNTDFALVTKKQLEEEYTLPNAFKAFRKYIT